nr:epithelial discoidin domain-containing receptor 1 [Lonchura striata domestica]
MSPGRCRFALGMQDGTIPDFRLSASSAWSDSTAARHGRLGRSDGDGAWCPAGPVFPAEQEFLEVDLGRLHVVTLVGTQGRHAGGHGREFARQYRLRYSRDRRRWLRWRDRWGHEVIGGNEDPEGVVLKDLSPAPVARALRVYPRAPRAMSVCLRLELYGCPWEAGLLSYTAPRGHVMALDPAPIVLNDSTYDGFSAGPLHFGGLGQLSDGVLGLDDFLRTHERHLWPGYDYVGWPRPPGPQPHVELEFEFQELRAFHAMQVHCNNLHTRGVGIFRAVECRFKKILATAWEPMVATHSLAGATKDASARWVAVPLGGRHARFIQCRFFFGAEWMLFSEVSFVSEVLDDPGGASGCPPTPDPSAAILENARDGGGATNVTSPVAPGEAELVPPVAQGEAGQSPALLGCLGAIILLLLAIIILILRRRRSAAGPLGKVTRFKKILATAWEPMVATHSLAGATKDASARWVAVPLGGRHARFIQCRFFFGAEWMLFSEVSFVSEVLDDPGGASGCPPTPDPSTAILENARDGGGATNGCGPEAALRVQLSGDTVVINNATGGGGARGGPRYERIGTGTGNGTGNGTGTGEYQEPTRARPRPPPLPPGAANPAYRLLLATYARPIGGLALAPPATAKPINTDGEPGAGAYAEADVTGGSAYALAGPAHSPAHGPALPSFPRHRLRFREKLGEGQFGEVLLCALRRAPGGPRRDFLQEARTLGRLRDPNIVRLLGVCGGPGPLCIVTEYMEHGDLHRFLGGARGHALRWDTPTHPHPGHAHRGHAHADLATLVDVGAQIASGMRFLAARNFVHRDLATRNCLVGEGLRVKVADFGMSRNLYGTGYGRVRGRALLPIRWMAWESILWGRFSPASDAWAFGVTLWEVLTRCREQPYGALSDEQVIANAGHHFHNRGQQQYLPCPPGCPPALHRLMLSCWAREAAERPDFGHLHRALSDHCALIFL